VEAGWEAADLAGWEAAAAAAAMEVKVAAEEETAVVEVAEVAEDSAVVVRIHILGARKTKSAYQHSASPDGRWHQTRRLLYLERDRQESYQRTQPM
jgi:hypothetical protein